MGRCAWVTKKVPATVPLVNVVVKIRLKLEQSQWWAVKCAIKLPPYA